MTANDADWKTIFDLFELIAKPSVDFTRRQLTEKELSDSEERLGYRLPGDLVTWLTFCNGAMVGPGGMYGLSCDDLDIVATMEELPLLLENRWFPVANDGCGNIFVYMPFYDQHDLKPVFFADMSRELDSSENYFVASNLAIFFLFSRELRQIRWPFDRATVLKLDSRLEELPADRLPWEG